MLHWFSWLIIITHCEVRGRRWTWQHTILSTCTKSEQTLAQQLFSYCIIDSHPLTYISGTKNRTLPYIGDSLLQTPLTLKYRVGNKYKLIEKKLKR